MREVNNHLTGFFFIYFFLGMKHRVHAVIGALIETFRIRRSFCPATKSYPSASGRYYIYI